MSSSSSSQPACLRVRLNNIDHIIDRGVTHDFETGSSSHISGPVIRVFGDSSTGKKSCVYIHGVYPYFFVEYKGPLDPEIVRKYISRLTIALNHAIALSLKRNPNTRHFVRKILLVKGVPFYGFHASYAPYLKILISDPSHVRRAVTILQTGTILQTKYTVYESHISFVLQFMCDFALYGCGWLDLGEEIYERGRELDESEESLFRPSRRYRQSRMALEVDVHAHQILNRHLITARDIHHKLEIPAPLLPDEPLIMSVRELWEDERNRRREKGLPPTPDIPREPSAESRGAGGEWVAEARWWSELRKRVEREREDIVMLDGEKDKWARYVMTTFESVEALWDPKWKTWKPRLHGDTQQPIPQETTPPPDRDEHEESVGSDVDETMLSLDKLNQLVEMEQEEWGKTNNVNEMAREDEEGLDGAAENDNPEDEEGDRSFHLSEFHDLGLNEEGPHPELQTAEQVVDKPSAETGPRTPPGSPGLKRALSPETTRLMTIPRAQRLIHLQTPRPRGMGNTPPQGTLPPSRRKSTQFLSNPKNGPSGGRVDQILELAKQSIEPSQLNFSIGSAVPLSSVRWNESSFATKSSFENGRSRTLKKRRLSARVSFPITNAPFTSTQSADNGDSYVYSKPPPTVAELVASGEAQDLPSKVYRNPHYAQNSDAPERAWEFGGLQYHLKGGDGLKFLEEWKDSTGDSSRRIPSTLETTGVDGWEYAGSPPSTAQARRWLVSDAKDNWLTQQMKLRSQIRRPTAANIYGLKSTFGDPSVVRERQSMSVLSMELFVPTRELLVPDGILDEIKAIVYAFRGPGTDSDSMETQTGMLVVDGQQLDPSRLRDMRITKVATELELINDFVDLANDLDPDIIAGWEIQSASWGYLTARAARYELDIGNCISRAPSRSTGNGNAAWAAEHSSSIRCVGRHVLNLWRVMRAEQSYTAHTFEHTAFNILQQRVPKYGYKTLTDWYTSNVPMHSARVLRYYHVRTLMVLDMLDKAEIVTKNAEFARVFGIDFFDVINRGSQFKVESFMFRMAKPESLVLVSPSKEQVGKQNAAECIPLIMEPMSGFYNSPLVVLDFASLYPSIMIAYNYCYTTCLGRVTDFQGRMKFGVLEDMQYPPGFIEKLSKHIHIAPNGLMFVKNEVRKGLLGRMLTELLDTRVMVKQSMKGVRGDKALAKVMDARQLALKFIANVTYGYTSASFSGRMPAVEIADSIVQSGRETLEKAIQCIDSNPKWGAKVVYGDTDSLFIYLRGKTKDQAFRLGHEMANTITAMNPVPIKLKFEKVYLPCLLMAKKRYVGFKYEHPDDKEPVFDAKGIETVRRDGVGAQRKMTETTIKMLFRTQDLSQVKEYCYDSWTKILSNKAAIEVFIFAKEVKLGAYSATAAPVPGAVVAALRAKKDPNSEPQYGERVPYIITQSLGGDTILLNQRAMDPLLMLKAKNVQIDGQYYIDRVLVPPLERIFNLVGADVRSWYNSMPRPIQNELPPDPHLVSPKKTKKHRAETADRLRIHQHFHNSVCLLCGGLAVAGICEDCKLDKQTAIAGLLDRIRVGENKIKDIQDVCASCTSSSPGDEVHCESLDCSWFFEKVKIERKSEFILVVRQVLEELLEEGGLYS